MEEMYINHLAVIVAAISMFVLGGLWYGPLFGKAWMDANGFTEQDLENSNPAKQYGLSLLFAIIMAYNLAGFLAGFGWVMLGVAVISLFEQRSWKYILVNGGYMTLAFTLMGLIIGAWR